MIGHFVQFDELNKNIETRMRGNAPFKSYGGSKFEIFIAFLDVSENSTTLSHFAPKREIFWGILRFWGKVVFGCYLLNVKCIKSERS